MDSKSILIVLDDLWNELSLEDLGIPHQRECTIILTSRDRDVFSAMNVEKSFQMEILEDVEAWSLFKEKVGACAEDQSLIPTAQKIVRECKGLPIALVTVGAALKDKTSKSIWEDAVEDLRSSNPRDIPEFLAQVYNPLKVSYDLLESEHAKSIFLLCCLFPEDHNILISNLSLYAWGLSMFEGIRSLQVARNKVQTLVEMLKSCFLLMEGRDGRYVKMHDVIRDVGIFIAAQEGLMDRNVNWNSWNNCSIDCSWISLFHHDNTGVDQITLRGGSVFPKLTFLLIEGEHSLSDDFSESSRKLHVLSISNYASRSLPYTIQFLKTLRTLILVNCNSLEDLSVVGELASLEILYCEWCPSIKELPVEIGRLNQLKLLHIWYCDNLKTIAAGVISRLISLEELTLMGSFKNWESGGASEGRNAAVCELNSLSNLTTLRIEINDASLAAEQIHLPNVVEFSISFGRGFEVPRSYERVMILELGNEVIIGDWIHQLLKTTQTLRLHGHGSSKLLPIIDLFTGLVNLIVSDCGNIKSLFSASIAINLVNLRQLSIVSCGEMVKVIEDKDDEVERSPFINLEMLRLQYLPKLKAFCDWKFSLEFPSLRHVLILELPLMERISSDSFNNLESLQIKSCSMLEQVVLLNEEEENGQTNHRITFPNLELLILEDLPRLTSFCKGRIQSIEFPKLRNLILEDLPRLTSFYKGIQSIEFPLLKEMVIRNCRKLKSVVSSSTENDDKYCSGHDSLHLFCKENQATFVRLKDLGIGGYDSIISLWCDQISIDFFTGLVDLTVRNCGNIKSLFTLSIAENLVNLTYLTIDSCDEMVKVIDGEEVERSPPFIKLEMLWLIKLPKLKAFCDWRCALELPSLRQVNIRECPEMVSFGSVTTPNLEEINMNDEDISDYRTKDLNDALFERDFLHLEVLFGSDE